MFHSDTPVAVIIDSPKGARERKINTFYVHPRYRQMQIGTQLLRERLATWRRLRVDRAYLTADESVALRLSSFLLGFGFQAIGREKDRYRYGASEHIYSADLRM